MMNPGRDRGPMRRTLMALAISRRPSWHSRVRDSAFLAQLRWRSVGPANMAGRVTDIEGNPQNPKEVYAAFATGGLWKTTNSGITWDQVSDRAGVHAMGDVAIAPSDTSIVWMGTGEEDSRNSISPGTGIFKSTDGGRTWHLMGLRNTHHIGRVVVHPDRPQHRLRRGARPRLGPQSRARRLQDHRRRPELAPGQVRERRRRRRGPGNGSAEPQPPVRDFLGAGARPVFPQERRAGLGTLGNAGRRRDLGQRSAGDRCPRRCGARASVVFAPSNANYVYTLIEADSAPNPDRCARRGSAASSPTRQGGRG